MVYPTYALGVKLHSQQSEVEVPNILNMLTSQANQHHMTAAQVIRSVHSFVQM